MKTISMALFLILFCGVSSPVFSADGVFLTLQIKQGQLRSTPSFLGRVTSTLTYGSKVKVVEDKGAWKKVSVRNTTGWIHESALTTKAIVMRSGKENVATEASQGEIVLAGKGFNSKVEAQFRSKDNSRYYTWVDKMEAQSVKPTQMQNFLKQGQVAVPQETVP